MIDDMVTVVTRVESDVHWEVFHILVVPILSTCIIFLYYTIMGSNLMLN